MTGTDRARCHIIEPASGFVSSSFLLALSAWIITNKLQRKMAAPAAAPPTAPQAGLFAQMNFGHPNPRYPLPMKKSTFKRPPKRSKNLKQILQAEVTARKNANGIATNGNSTPVFAEGGGNTPTASSAATGLQSLSWASIEAPPSVLPPKKYCDITGLEAHYQDPKSRLRYHNSEIFRVVRGLMGGIDQQVCVFMPVSILHLLTLPVLVS